MLKLRTMWDGETPRGAGLVEHIEDDRGPELKSEADSRISCRLARFCRRHSIDELPQFLLRTLPEVFRGKNSW